MGMRSFGQGLLGPVIGLLALAVAAGCSQSESYEDEASEDQLRSDPNALVATRDPGVRLLSPYNALLDRAQTTECVTGATGADVGDVRGEFYLRHVSTREELAKEL